MAKNITSQEHLDLVNMFTHLQDGIKNRRLDAKFPASVNLEEITAMQNTLVTTRAQYEQQEIKARQMHDQYKEKFDQAMIIYRNNKNAIQAHYTKTSNTLTEFGIKPHAVQKSRRPASSAPATTTTTAAATTGTTTTPASTTTASTGTTGTTASTTTPHA